METRAHHVLIGLFTVLLVVAGLLFGLWLSKSSADTNFKDYQVVFNEAVTGLSRGSVVQYSGIKVGDVVQLHLDPNDPRRVLARIRVTGDTPIKQDTVAKLGLTSITGGAIIQLSGGTPQSENLTSNVKGELPIITASPSPIARLLSNSSELATNINQLLHNANAMFSSDNVTRISKTLDHLEQTTGAIADQRNDISQTLQQLALLSKQANATLEQTTTLMRSANGLLNNQGKEVLGSAQQVMNSLQRSSATVEQLLHNNQDALNKGAQGLSELGPALRDLRDTLNSVHTVSRRLETNPSGYLFGREKDTEFKP